MTIIIDVHAHLDHPDIIDNIDDVITRAKEAGVKVIIAQGGDKASNRKVLEFSEKYDIVRPAIGIYPPDALQTEQGDAFQPYDVEQEIDFIRSQDPIAIGEVGLDMSTGKDLEAQKGIFRRMVGIAEEKNIPLIIHSRKSELHILDILEESGYKKVVLHCFCGRKHLVKRAADLGYYFSIPTNVVKSEQFQQLVREVHISKLLTETDSPFLSPFQGRTNEPAFVIEALKKIAELKGMTLDDTANNIFMNYQDLFE